MPWRVSSFRSRAGFSARMTTSRQPPAWTGATITPPNFPGSSCITAFSYTLKGLSKTKLSRCSIVLQEKYSWREQNGINRGGQSTAVKHGQGSQRQRAPDVHGANRSSLGRRWSAVGGTRGGLESRDDTQRNA